ncbi:hypothetical protein BSKO_01673 [Bryopsis sp. KO-2023]|nr:hypothetical protein BSKO_01673 [Bryopsis sp. KO-2023]
MANNRRPSTWSSLLPSPSPEVGFGIFRRVDEIPQNGGWLAGSGQTTCQQTSQKESTESSYHHGISSSVVADLLAEKSQKAQYDVRNPGIEMNYETGQPLFFFQVTMSNIAEEVDLAVSDYVFWFFFNADDLVVAGGSLNYTGIPNSSGLSCQTPSNHGAYFDRTLSTGGGKSPSNRSPPKTPHKEASRVTSIGGASPVQEIQMFESPDMPGVMVVRRSEVVKMESPNKLMLDHCNLRECCMLEGEEELRLLNYEHNHIGRISNMEGLRHLVFLDLFSNCLERISGLETLTNLKYLLLGRNHIRRITNLEGLRFLDVLDLHDNLLDSMDGVGSLMSLRVLNLAGNRINGMRNIVQLTNLVELNLKRNFLLSLAALDVRQPSLDAPDCTPSLPTSLHYLFLSHNRNFTQRLNLRIVSFDALLPLTHLSELRELSLDGNPVGNSIPPQAYRKGILELCPSNIEVLDSQTVSGVSMYFIISFRPRYSDSHFDIGAVYGVFGSTPFHLFPPVPVESDSGTLIYCSKQITGEERCWSSAAAARKAFEDDIASLSDSHTETGSLRGNRAEKSAAIVQTSSNYCKEDVSERGNCATIPDLGDWESELPTRINERTGELSWRTYEWTKPGKKQQTQRPPHPKSARSKPEHATELASPPYSPFGGCPPVQDSQTAEQTAETGGLAELCGVEASQDDAMSISVRTVSSGTSDTFSLGNRESPLAIDSCSVAAGASNRREDTTNATDIIFTNTHTQSAVNNALSGKRESTLNKALNRHYWNRSNPTQPKEPPEQGVVELLDGHRLCLYGNVLYALGNASAAHVTDVCIKYIGWDAVVSSIPKLAALTRLKKLVFEHNRLEFLSQLDCLRSVTRLQSLTIQFNPVASLALFGAYVTHKLPQIKALNGRQITEVDRGKGKKLFQPVQDAIQRRGSAPLSSLSVEDSKSISALITKRSAQGYVNRMLCGAMAAERRIRKLDDVWDSILIEHLKEGFRQARDVVQYDVAVLGETDSKLKA